MSEISSHTVTIAKRRFELRRDRIERAARRVLPEPIAKHYVVVGRRRYPPKQVIGLVTGLDRADFTTHQARRVLMGLGFAVGRQAAADVPRSSEDRVITGHELAETLKSLRGQWVATKNEEVLVAASSPQELVGWLARHDRHADSMFRVPEDELAFGGLAPL